MCYKSHNLGSQRQFMKLFLVNANDFIFLPYKSMSYELKMYKQS